MANKLNLEWYVGTVGAGKGGSGQFLPLPRFSLLWLHSYVLRQSPTYLLLLSEKYDYCWGKYKNNWKGPTNCIPTPSDICQPAPLSEGYDNSQGKYRETKRQKMHSYVLRQSPTYLFLLSKIYNLWDQQNELKKRLWWKGKMSVRLHSYPLGAFQTSPSCFSLRCFEKIIHYDNIPT